MKYTSLFNFNYLAALFFFFTHILTAQANELLRAIPWKTGQIIGISEMHYAPFTFFYEAATGSRYGHIGIIYRSEDNLLYVYEANPPQVRRTTLQEFLSRTTKNPQGFPEFTLTELNEPLSMRQESELLNVMNQMLGTRYNYTMVMNDKTVNCSEFIHKVFKKIGIDQIGIPEPLRNSNLTVFDGALLKHWKKPLPLDDLAVSPFSVISSPKTHIISEGLPTGRVMSDAEILEIWIKQGGIADFAKLFKENPRHCELYLSSKSSNAPYREYPKNWRQ